MAGKPKDGSMSKSAVEEFLECPVCMEVPNCIPIYQCPNGHCLCKPCHKKLSLCPTCRVHLGFIRCLMAEKLLEKVPVSCQFVKNGCPQR